MSTKLTSHEVQNSSLYFGYSFSLFGIGQTFQIPTDATVDKVSLYLKKVGDPTINIELQIGTGWGSAISNGVAYPVSGGALGADYAWMDFEFTTPPNLLSGTTYYLRVRPQGDVVSVTNYFVLGIDSGAGYGSGQLFKEAPKNTFTGQSADGNFQLWGEIIDVEAEDTVHAHAADKVTVSPHLTVQDATSGHATDCAGRVDILLNGVMARDTLHRHSTDTLAVYTPYARAEMTLPMLECLGTTGVWGNADFNLTVPSLVAYGGGTAEIELTVLEVEATGSWYIQGASTLTLPLLEAEAYSGGVLDLALPVLRAESTGLLGPHGVAELTLTSLEIEAYGGGSLSIILPGLEISAAGLADVIGSLEVDLPGLGVSASGLVEILGSCIVNLPVLQAIASGYPGPKGTVEFDLVPLQLEGTGVTGIVGDGDIDLIILSCVATGFDNIDGDLSMDLPALEMYLSVGAVHGRFDAYVLRYIRGELW